MNGLHPVGPSRCTTTTGPYVLRTLREHDARGVRARTLFRRGDRQRRHPLAIGPHDRTRGGRYHVHAPRGSRHPRCPSLRPTTVRSRTWWGGRSRRFYLWWLGVILLVSLAVVRVASGAPLSRMRPYADLFCMGAAFLLLETKSVVQFALLFGTTWFVNSLVFAGILLAVLAAVELARRVRLPSPPVMYGVLLGLPGDRLVRAARRAAGAGDRAAGSSSAWWWRSPRCSWRT